MQCFTLTSSCWVINLRWRVAYLSVTSLINIVIVRWHQVLHFRYSQENVLSIAFYWLPPFYSSSITARAVLALGPGVSHWCVSPLNIILCLSLSHLLSLLSPYMCLWRVIMLTTSVVISTIIKNAQRHDQSEVQVHWSSSRVICLHGGDLSPKCGLSQVLLTAQSLLSYWSSPLNLTPPRFRLNTIALIT